MKPCLYRVVVICHISIWKGTLKMTMRLNISLCGNIVPNSFLRTFWVAYGAALARFKDGTSSFYSFAKSLGWKHTSAASNLLAWRDRHIIARSIYNESEKAKNLRKQCQKRRKGLDDRKKMEEKRPRHMTGMDGIEQVDQPSKWKN